MKKKEIMEHCPKRTKGERFLLGQISSRKYLGCVISCDFEFDQVLKI